MENKGMLIDVKSCLKLVSAHIDAGKILQEKYYAAIEFAEKHIKGGKPWDEECEKVIGEALHPKPPKGSAT